MVLAGAAQPATADTGLLVEGHLDAGNALGVALLTTIRSGGTSGEADEVDRGKNGEFVPRVALSDRHLVDGTVALHTGGLLESVALFLAALVESRPQRVVTHELIGAIGAVLDPVAALAVVDDFLIRTDESVVEACARHVMTVGEGVLGVDLWIGGSGCSGDGVDCDQEQRKDCAHEESEIAVIRNLFNSKNTIYWQYGRRMTTLLIIRESIIS